MTPGKSVLNILGISGSLKAGSVNTALLHEIQQLAGDPVNYTVFDGLEDLPPFNPDKEEGNAAVKKFKQLLQEADGIVISTPEYAFGLPGVLKNALDWTVHSGELNAKPLIAVSASPLSTGGSRAMTSLLPTLSALGTITGEQAYISIPDILKKTNAEKRLTDEATKQQLKTLFEHLVATIRDKKPA